jgi:hypothetical protein
MAKRYDIIYRLVVVVVVGVFLAGCAVAPSGVETSRVGAKPVLTLSAPNGFSFAVFSDRTGGDQAEGTRVWRQAIAQANRMRPDFVYTVGDLIWGYGDRQTWLKEAEAFHADTQLLEMPFNFSLG